MMMAEKVSKNQVIKALKRRGMVMEKVPGGMLRVKGAAVDRVFDSIELVAKWLEVK